MVAEVHSGRLQVSEAGAPECTMCIGPVVAMWGGRVPVEPARSAWSDEESEAAFRQLGDRVIDATRVWGRSRRRQRLQRDLYTVEGVQLSLGQVDALETVARGSVRM